MNRVLQQVGLALFGAVVIIATLAFSFLAIPILATATDLTPPFYQAPRANTLFALVSTVAPLFMAFIMGHWLVRRGWFAVFSGSHALLKYRRVFLVLIAANYMLTVVLGVPAVQNYTGRQVAARHMDIKESEPPGVVSIVFQLSVLCYVCCRGRYTRTHFHLSRGAIRSS